MKILIVDNNIDPSSWGASDLRESVAQQSRDLDAAIYVRRAPQGDLPANPESFDRIILSGSKTSGMASEPWIAKLDDFIRAAISKKKPLLGVCYGHQSIVRVVGGRESLRKAAEAEFGWTEIELTEESTLLNGLPHTFFSFSAHFEEVAKLPSPLKNLASSKDCAIQAFEMERHPVFGIQFHPERGVAQAEETFSHRRKVGIPKRLLHAKESRKLYNPEVGAKIFRNFLELA